jgi:hypothetical protein
MLTLLQKIVVFIFIIWVQVEDRDYDNNPIMKEKAIEKHFDFRLNGSTLMLITILHIQEATMSMVMLCFVMN